MINLNPVIYNSLKKIGIRVVKNYPKSNSEYPCLVYKEIVNIPVFKVNGVEVISDISYQFDIYSLNDVELNEIVKSVNSVISSMGFNRRFNESMDTSSYFRRVLRYSGKYDARSNLIYE